MRKVVDVFMLPSDEDRFAHDLLARRGGIRFVSPRRWSEGGDPGRQHPAEIPDRVVEIWDATVSPEVPRGVQWIRSLPREPHLLLEGRLAVEYHKNDAPGIDELVGDVWSALSATTITPVLRWPDGTLDKKIRLGIDTHEHVIRSELQLRHGALTLVLD